MKEGLCIDGPAKGSVYFNDADCLKLDLDERPEVLLAKDGAAPLNDTIELVIYRKEWWFESTPTSYKTFYVWVYS